MKLNLNGHGHSERYDEPVFKKRDGLQYSSPQKSIYELNNSSITPVTFTGIRNIKQMTNIASGLQGRMKAIKGLPKIFSRQTTYKNYSKIFADIDMNNNDRATVLLKKIQGEKSPYNVIVDKNADTITFVDKTIKRKLAEGLLYPAKNLFLDIGNYLFKGLKKVSFLNENKYINRVYDSKILANRRNQNALMYTFNSLNGMLDKYVNNKGIRSSAEEYARSIVYNLKGDKGNYDTRSERALNRLATGLVSASFIERDFYNISRLQNDNDAMAKKTGKQRKKQEVTRIGLMAFLTFVTLGAFSKFTNKSKYAATAVIAGTTLISEIIARVANGTPLTPLSPNSAKKHRANLIEKGKFIDNKNKKPDTPQSPSPSILGENKYRYLNTDDVNGFLKDLQKDSPAGKTDNIFPLRFKGDDIEEDNNDIDTEEKKQTEKPDYEQEKENVKKGVKVALGAAGAFVLASMGYVYASSKSSTLKGVNGLIIRTGEKAYDKIFKKNFIVEKRPTDAIVKNLKDQKYSDLIREYAKTLRGNTVNPIMSRLRGRERMCYQMGRTKNALAMPLSFITYPIKFIWNIISLPARKLHEKLNKNVIKKPEVTCRTYRIKKLPPEISLSAKKLSSAERSIRTKSMPECKSKFLAFYEETSKKLVMEEVGQEDKLQSLYKTFNKKMIELKKGIISQDEYNNFVEQTIDRTFNNMNFSQQSTKSLASFSRIFVTLITSYFFINDYRNQVLIESDGQDTQRAKEVTNERIMQKVANLILNSMFMMLFNTTFSKTLNSGLIGATAVAAATEMTNESAVRLVIGTPIEKMSKDEILKHEKENYYDESMKGKWFRAVSTLTGKKPLSEKAKQE